MLLYIIDGYNKSLHLHTCIVVFLTPHPLYRQAAICAKSAGTCLEASTNHVLHVFYWERGTEGRRGRRKVRERNRQRKGGGKGGLSEACVRGVPCWCQFHSSSSMLRSFSHPQRDQLVLRERERERDGEREEEIRVIEIIERQVQVWDEIEKRKTSDRFVNIAFHAAVVFNYMPRRAWEFCMCSISIPPNNRALSQYLVLCPLWHFYLVCGLRCGESWNGESLIVHNVRLRSQNPGEASQHLFRRRWLSLQDHFYIILPPQRQFSF